MSDPRVDTMAIEHKYGLHRPAEKVCSARQSWQRPVEISDTTRLQAWLGLVKVSQMAMLLAEQQTPT